MIIFQILQNNVSSRLCSCSFPTLLAILIHISQFHSFITMKIYTYSLTSMRILSRFHETIFANIPNWLPSEAHHSPTDCRKSTPPNDSTTFRRASAPSAIANLSRCGCQPGTTQVRAAVGALHTAKGVEANTIRLPDNGRYDHIPTALHSPTLHTCRFMNKSYVVRIDKRIDRRRNARCSCGSTRTVCRTHPN